MGQSSRMLTVARAHRSRWHTGPISDHAKRTMARVRCKRYPFDCNISLMNDSKPEQVGMLGNKRYLQKQIGKPASQETRGLARTLVLDFQGRAERTDGCHF